MKELILSNFPDLIDTLFIYERSNYIVLSNIILKEEMRNQGYGKKIMKFICQYADNVQKPILLSPQSPDDYMTDEQLIKFYEKFDFVPNKGAIRDYSMESHSYKRIPK